MARSCSPKSSWESLLSSPSILGVFWQPMSFLGLYIHHANYLHVVSSCPYSHSYVLTSAFSYCDVPQSIQNVYLLRTLWLWERAKSCMVADPVNNVDEDTLHLFRSLPFLAAAFIIILITPHENRKQDFENLLQKEGRMMGKSVWSQVECFEGG